MDAVEVSVSPQRRSVHLGQDAEFSCHARNVPAYVEFHWQVPPNIIDSGRLEDSGNTLRILDTTAADNNTDITCFVLDQKDLLGAGMAELVVMPALPVTEAPTSTAAASEITTRVGTTSKVETTAKVGTTAKPVITEPSTLPRTSQEATSAPTTQSTTPTVLPTSAELTTLNIETTASVGDDGTTGHPSKLPNGSHQGPTQSPVSGLGPGVIAPAVVGGLVFFICILVTGFFLMRRHHRKSKATDAEEGASASKQHAEFHMYEFITPGCLDFKDGGNSDEENHNKKKHGNNYVNRDSLRTYSRGTAPDSITRYTMAVPRKDRIVHGGGHGGKPRRAPVLTLSMNSLYEETTPTFVVANPKSGQVDVIPYKSSPEEAVEIVGQVGPSRGCDTDDEEQYVTLAHNPPMPEENNCHEHNMLFK